MIGLKYKNLIKRIKLYRIKITGISIPFFGVSWGRERSDKFYALQIYNHMKDRRVLYVGWDDEFIEAVVESVRMIRSWLQNLLDEIPDRFELVKIVSSLQECCREFLSDIEPELPIPFYVKAQIILIGNHDRFPKGINTKIWIYFNALRNLRHCFAKNLTKLDKYTNINIKAFTKKIHESAEAMPIFKKMEDGKFYTEEIVKSEIKNSIERAGGPYNNWYLGVCSADVERILFSKHRVLKDNGIWIYYPASSSKIAKKILKEFKELGVLCTESNDINKDAKILYAFRMTKSTKPMIKS